MRLGVINNIMNSDDKMVKISIKVPRKLLDLLSFRYYSLNIVENDNALVQTAVEEVAGQQFGLEFGSWSMRNQTKTMEQLQEVNLHT